MNGMFTKSILQASVCDSGCIRRLLNGGVSDSINGHRFGSKMISANKTFPPRLSTFLGNCLPEVSPTQGFSNMLGPFSTPKKLTHSFVSFNGMSFSSESHRGTTSTRDQVVKHRIINRIEVINPFSFGLIQCISSFTFLDNITRKEICSVFGNGFPEKISATQIRSMFTVRIRTFSDVTFSVNGVGSDVNETVHDDISMISSVFTKRDHSCIIKRETAHL